MRSVPGNLPPAAVVRKLLDYDPSTGALTWTAGTRRYPNTGKRMAGHTAFRRRHGTLLGKWVMASRVAWLHYTGSPPATRVDYADGDNNNLRAANLRVRGMPPVPQAAPPAAD